MGGLKLYTYPKNKNSYKALIAAEYVGVKIEVPNFNMGVDNKKPEFLKLNPFGKVPTLETPEGGIFESNAIARHIARQADVGLFGKTPIEMGQVEAWIDHVTNELDGPTFSWLMPLVGYWPRDEKKEAGAQESMKKALASLDSYLESHTFLVGDRITLADIIAACNLHLGYTMLFEEPFRAPFPNVTRYYVTLANQPEFKKVLGNVELCKKTVSPPEKKEEVPKAAPKEEAPKAAPKEAKPKQEPKPKAAPKPKEEKPKPDAADEDDEPKPVKKEKNALDLLPPSKMILDSWKRLYSNTPARTFDHAIQGLWAGADIPNSPNSEHFEGFDPEGFSVWFCEYKYPEENTVNFIVMNKVGGFLQRIDYVRKYAFGVMCILKNEKGEFPIKGVWIFRGQAIPPMMIEECYDLELYTWEKVDISNATQKKRVEDMIAETDKIDGLENVECKVFK